MTDPMDYRCVNCGEPASALFKSYGPTVLKLTKCEKCREIVDKYVEYDPVIVMIDLVLMSKEAHRHVLYNSEFKAYWKLLIILTILETYGVWRSESLFSVAIYTICGIQSSVTINTTQFLRAPLIACEAWAPRGDADETDLFIWETDFYVKFLSVAAGVFAFILTVQICMEILKPFCSQHYVSVRALVRAFSVAQASGALALAGLVWGAGEGEGDAHTTLVHLALVHGYGAAAFANVLSVLYGCPVAVTILVFMLSNMSKYAISFHITPYLRNFII